MFGRIVLGVKAERFDEPLEAAKEKHGKGAKDTDLNVSDLQALVARYKSVVREDIGREFPDDPNEQLDLAIKAVFASWFGKRANDYRNSQKIAHDLGTAVNVVTMVFGNMGDDSGTGVAFTRDPNTGEKVLYGEYLTNAQGEDVVAGIRTPSPISALAQEMPAVFAQFKATADKLEKHYKDVQDLEFTIERGKLYMLQTRNAKRSAAAALRIAVDMAEAPDIALSKAEAVGRTATYLANPPRIAVQREDDSTALTIGRAASPGVACGQIVTSPDAAEVEAGAGQEGDPRAFRDVPGRLPWHESGSGDPDLHRWHDFTRRGRGPRVRYPRSRRRRRDGGRRRGNNDPGAALQGGRDHHDRRVHGRGLRR
jgi:pyruvate,orthophosphate dikinase